MHRAYDLTRTAERRLPPLPPPPPYESPSAPTEDQHQHHDDHYDQYHQPDVHVTSLPSGRTQVLVASSCGFASCCFAHCSRAWPLSSFHLPSMMFQSICVSLSLRLSRAPVEQRTEDHAQQHAEDGGEDHQPDKRDRRGADHPADLDAARVGDHERDQDDEQGDRDARIEVEAGPMGFTGETLATRLAGDLHRDGPARRMIDRLSRLGLPGEWFTRIHVALHLSADNANSLRWVAGRLRSGGLVRAR